MNRTYGQTKTHGLIVDYIGIFDDVAQALDFDEKAVQQVVSNIDELRKALPVQVQKCLAFFPNVDRSVGGYEGLMAAQQCLPDNATRDKFAAEYSVLGTIWEALSPDPCLSAYAKDYKWLKQVYESVKPVSGNGKLLWHRLGAKTIELINENVHFEAVRDDIEALVLDADVLDSILKDANPSKKAREVEIKLIARLKKHAGNPKFKELGERLEKIRERHKQGLLNSLEFLKAILDVAKDTVATENQIDPEEEQDKTLAALTELFNEVKSKQTQVIVERLVADIDGIVRQIRFDGWQTTSSGEGKFRRLCGLLCGYTNCTRTRNCSIRLMGISGSIIELLKFLSTFPHHTGFSSRQGICTTGGSINRTTQKGSGATGVRGLPTCAV